ncbi:Trimethylamine-N-oxide reductase (cytochrome c) [Rhizobium sp. CF080]|uniref:molybdopterin-dependent oxidoreductase n=1 Tax=Rhizobium sp. (strain CF080) TaxID=1144310 RepID=UPI00027178C9|nr:molybdopterin-dependent oxidoreductase [Rhizobium sp. CF080]EUC00004.1 Trimethylamine-N-oxide reductase (cytochrome c) [Rhizobium sp. CF080]
MNETPDDGFLTHSSHWGAFHGRWRDDGLEVRAFADDPSPSAILGNLETAARHKSRIARPMVRRGWLENGPGPTDRRGSDTYVAMEWDEVVPLLAGEFRRVYSDYGPRAVYGGSYGWSSAGRFHHAQSQVHRFLNCLGGYVRSVNNYSAGAAMVILPRVFAGYDESYLNSVRFEEMAEHTDLVLSFGGMAAKNGSVTGGGTSRHLVPGYLAAMQSRGCSFHLFSPLKADFDPAIGAQWHAIRPGTDVAVLLAIAHTMVMDGTHDRAFLDRCCIGFGTFEDYLLGREDNQPKNARWASGICGIPEEDILAVARKIAGRRTVIAVSQSVQRAEHGEQPIWMAIVLAAMTGQIGLPGGGFCYGLGSMADSGTRRVAVSAVALDQGRNPVRDFIPCASISEMLLNPGGTQDYNGETLTFPDIRLVYWAGGNPFHHHQDLGRLRQAFGRPDTIVVHESVWTASAKHADIVLPATMTLERNDIASSRSDERIIAMHRLVPPFAEARDDYTIFSMLAAALGVGEAFTEGRSEEEWLRALYAATARKCEAANWSLPDFDTFWREGQAKLPFAKFDGGLLRRFRDNPEDHPLPTASGRIEISSPTIASFGYSDCPEHPAWIPPVEGAGSPRMARFALQLVANQPAVRLHSQLDFGTLSQSSKRDGREPMMINPADAGMRGIADGDIVRVFNDRGAFLASAVVSGDIREGVVQIATGAWFNPVETADGSVFCAHGNPNAVTRDAGTSRFAQGSTGQLCLVEMERYDVRPLPSITAYDMPVVEALPAARRS